jgi:D-alanyl-lipoteichoic acid acyltransferase DltB (MBOAT superfamily)
LNLYWNFSGASDLAIGASRFFGVKIAENFDLPYARPNLSEFWRAWHVTLSMWLRDFLFFPIGKRMPRGTAPIVAPLIVMSLCGLWHGLTLPFLAWGFLHGAGLAAHQLWLRARRANATLDAASASIAGRTLGAVLTTHFVALTWVFFAAPSPAVAFANLRSLFSADFRTVETLAWGAVAVAAWSFAPAIRDALRAKAAEASTSIAHHLATLWRTHVDVICVFILVARFLLGRLQPEGAFVYQGF